MIRLFLIAILSCFALPVFAQAPTQDESPDLYAPARRWALVIGAGDYVHLGKLNFAGRDAKAFSSALQESFGFDESTLTLLTDDAEEPTARPTAGNMFLALRQILGDPRLQQTDLFVFYFAGHGIGDKQGDYLLPVDGALETVTDVGLHVQDVIKELAKAGMSNVLFVVDGCRTGESNTFGKELWELAEESNLAVVLACEPGQQSFEDRRLGGGVFTHFLVESLSDGSAVDAQSGALWASRVAEKTRDKVKAWTSRGFGGQQVPQVWTDPTRDVLIGAELLRGAESILSSLAANADKLDLKSYLGATARYAELLFAAERYSECAELLKAFEQMGELPPHLLYLMADSLQCEGRYAEMKRVQSTLLETAPDSLYALTVIAHDLSGETSGQARYEASMRLWQNWVIEAEDLALLVAFNIAIGGPHDEARAVLDEMLPRFRPNTRAHAYARYMSHSLDGEYELGLELLEQAETFPGEYPGPNRLRIERFGLLSESKRNAEVLALLNLCVKEWPEDSSWIARRASFHYKSDQWDAATADVLQALSLELSPLRLLEVVRAAGIRSGQLTAAVSKHAVKYPLSWEATLARAMCTLDSEQAHQAGLDAAKRLAPELGTWSTTVASIQLERAREAALKGEITPAYFSNLRFDLLDVLADRAAELDQDAGWELLCELAVACSRQRQIASLITLHLGDTIRAGELQRAVVGPVAFAYLDAGELEKFREAIAQASPFSGLAAGGAWVEAAWLVCADRDDEARTLVEDLPTPTASMLASSVYLQAALLARKGEAEKASAVLAGAQKLKTSDILGNALAGLAHEALGSRKLADEHFGIVLDTSGQWPFFAKAACLRAFHKREDSAEFRSALAFSASRDSIDNPLTASLTFADPASLDSFRGSVEFEIVDGAGALAASGANLLVNFRREGKVSGIVERPDGSIWSFSGVVDRFGNLQATLKGAGTSAHVYAKLAPPDVYLTNPLLQEHGAIFLVLDDKYRASGWMARAIP